MPKSGSRSSSKGLELPINMIVVIAIAVLVLVVIAAFFSGQLGAGADTVSLEKAFQDGCQALRFSENCNARMTDSIQTGYDLPGSPKGSGSSLQRVCETRSPAVFSTATDRNAACARLCGCATPSP